ncbi:MAG: hypothetical protein KKH32_00760 [Bacteroidetes bacterium]|nr:hypothetical protein [Bacteroidota bacterium]
MILRNFSYFNYLLRIFFKYFILLGSIFLLHQSAEANPGFLIETKTDTIRFINKSEFLIDSVYLIDSILSVSLNGRELLNEDFSFSTHDQLLKLNIEVDSIFENVLIVTYRFLPIKKNIIFFQNRLVVKRDTSIGREIQAVEKKSTPFSSRDLFGSQLEKSGTLVRGFTVGSNKDLTLNSGLRLQLAGKLSDDIEIVAALTDENSPIQPEGNTQTIQELDKVFIELRHKNVQGTFGDFQIEKSIGEFGVINRKLQGLQSQFQLGDELGGSISYASSRGKFNSQNFFGLDGVQGPYRLSGVHGGREIIVIAGTEKVFINGEQLARGENYDYTIDYSTGELFFTPKKIITLSTRISIEFEYTDRKYERNFFGSTVSSRLLKGNLQIGASYFREGDDQNAPIDISLSENDKSILTASGNDRFKASKSGVKYVGYDSLGIPQGLYVEKDTVINSQVFKYYLYLPGNVQALYNISFSFVGVGKGDYVKSGIGQFKFVGVGIGSYLPIALLPLPELNQVGNIFLSTRIFERFYSDLEFSISSKDQNRFSSAGDQNILGKAYRIKLGVDSLNVNLFNEQIGSVGMTYYESFVERTYSPINRIFEVEYKRNWNVEQTSSNENERLREIGFNFNRDRFSFISSLGFLRKGNSFSTDRTILSLNTEPIDKLKLAYSFTNLKTKTEIVNSSWQKHLGNISYNFGGIIPEFRIEAEEKLDRLKNSDSVALSSQKFIDITSRLTVQKISWLSVIAEYNHRNDYLPLLGRLIKESKSDIFQLNFSTKQLRNINSSLSVAYRQKKFTDEYKTKGFLDNNSLVVKYLGRGTFFDRFAGLELYYETSSQRSAKLEKVFLRVAKGTGSYIYRGDLNNNGVADEFEFEPAKFDGDYILTTFPTDELFPVTDVKASSRIRFEFENLKMTGFFQDILKPISTETYLRVEENSRDASAKNVYLINLKTFRNPNTTIKGNNLIQQDIYLFQNSSEFNTLFRFLERRSFNKYNISDERRFQQEKSIRVRLRLIKEFANQTEIINLNDDLNSSAGGFRNHNISSNAMVTKFSYFPYRNVEVGMKFEISRGFDYFHANATQLDVNSQQISLIISLSDLSRLNVELERSELIVNNLMNQLPFELSKGNSTGKNYLWRVNFDYRFSTNLQSNISYDGRIHGESNTIHSARAELRAYF